MKNVSALENIHKHGLFGNHDSKDELINIREIKNILIYQIVKYKNSNENISVYLKNRNVELAKRLFQIKECRPLISNIESEEKMIEFVSKHLFEREVFHNQATIKIDCHGNDINTICKEIISVLN